MDFLDPKKKRGYNIRLVVGFILISIAIVLGTIILALITAGYTINRKTGQVIQNSLVFINSQPTSATIYVNGVNSGTTNARLNLDAGNYTFSLQQNGYRSWSNNVTLLGGDVLQLVYPFLFPTNPLKTSIVTLTGEPAIATYTPDRHWMLISVPGQPDSFYEIDLTNLKTPITTITIPQSVLGTVPGANVLSAVKWSTDNQHLLIKDSYTGGTQYIMLDRLNPANSVNINQLFPNTPFTSIILDNNTYNKLYLYNQPTENLALGDINAKTTTNILGNVISYRTYSNNQILYTTPDPKNKSAVDANLWNSNGQNFTLRDLPVGSSYELNMASYNGHLYVVIGSNSSNFAYVYMDPSSELSSNPNVLPLPNTLLIVSGTPDNVTFSNSARFIALQSGSQFSIYDLQYDTHYHYDTGLSFQPNQLADWMDGNRLDAVIGGKLTIWDFDGTNMISYVESSSNFLPAFNQNYSAVYDVIPGPNLANSQWQVVRNSLIANTP